MPKIYIVQSSHGEYEDYRETNEKAFYNKEDAEKYAKELDKKHNDTPDFITDAFTLAYDNIFTPEWPDPPCNPFDDYDKYQVWLKEMIDNDRKFIINEMYKQGFFVTEQMIDVYDEWYENQYTDWHDCIVEEIELV